MATADDKQTIVCITSLPNLTSKRMHWRR